MYDHISSIGEKSQRVIFNHSADAINSFIQHSALLQKRGSEIYYEPDPMGGLLLARKIVNIYYISFVARAALCKRILLATEANDYNLLLEKG